MGDHIYFGGLCLQERPAKLNVNVVGFKCVYCDASGPPGGVSESPFDTTAAVTTVDHAMVTLKQ